MLYKLFRKIEFFHHSLHLIFMLFLLDLYMIQLQILSILIFLIVLTWIIEFLYHIDLVYIASNDESLSTDLRKLIKKGQRYTYLLFILRSLDKLVE